jgi:pimeloyl-ACP methyl ester carboxylesterase
MDGTVVDIGDLGIFFVEHGEGVPVLYVHGNVASCRWFQRVMNVPGAHTVALDMPNFGRSKPLPGEADIDRYADAVFAFVGARGLDRPVIVGHSLGGSVVMSLAVRYPDLPRAIVLVDSASPAGLVTPRERHPAIEMMRTNRAVLSAALRAIAPTLKDEEFFSQLVDDGERLAAPAWIGNAEALGRACYTGRTAAFAGPVLVVWGRKDPIVTEGMARETAAAFPDARLSILEEVGHSVMAEDPPRFVSLLEEFLRSRRMAE